MSQIPKIGLGWGVVLLAAGLMMGCGASPTPMPLPPTPTDVQVAVVPPPTPTVPASPTPPPAIIAPDDSCVNCHTDQDRLIATAAEKKVVEPLSEGEG
ncbi:MAG: hypothetical protein AB1801_21110 [Chloroflexota bacterium]